MQESDIEKYDQYKEEIKNNSEPDRSELQERLSDFKKQNQVLAKEILFQNKKRTSNIIDTDSKKSCVECSFIINKT